ncbi:MAG: mechanosensitive ion channel [Bergeyella zoohelcum]|nr:mechanosensitive ion channel [Bergeyella zoohelcum]
MKEEIKNNVGQISDSVSLTFKEILEYKIFSLGGYSLSVYEVLAATIIVLVGWAVSKLVKRLIYKSDRIELSNKFAFSQIIGYAITALTFLLTMRSLGVDISPLLVGSGAILVGIGLGLQNLFLDFISGIIILVDRSVKVGDIVDIDGTVGQIQEIKMRTATILTRDNKNIIFPNSTLTKNKIINFSHNDNEVSFSVAVGVHYDSDLDLVEKLMIEAALEQEDVINNDTIKPSVSLVNFGDSSLDMVLYYRSSKLFRQEGLRSDIRKSILQKFRENNVDIPYPTRTMEVPVNKETN